MRDESFQVQIKAQWRPLLDTLPQRIQFKLLALVEDLRRNGPEPPGWPTLTPRGRGQYRCNLEGRWLTGWMVQATVIELLPPGSGVGRTAMEGEFNG